jgi:hypothetical protein
METGASSGQEVLQLRAVLRVISPLIWRRPHQILQVAFGWQDMHLHRFQIRGREYGVNQEGGVVFDTDADKALIGQLELQGLERFTYEYDFGDLWVHDLSIEAALPLSPGGRARAGNQLADHAPIGRVPVAGQQRGRVALPCSAEDQRLSPGEEADEGCMGGTLNISRHDPICSRVRRRHP